jgi:pSer/pThr/pTyr-binding forkhead associated (FHA) protein
MKVKLKILKGSNAGKEVRIPTPKCLIGRSDECHMRPKSEAVSRRHCVIYIKDGKVFIRDLKSRNGTIVNNQPIQGDYELKGGEVVQVGPMVFEMLIDYTLGGEKKSKITSVKDAAQRTTTSSKEAGLLDDGDIGGWLDEADHLERSRRLSDPETRQLKLDETDQVKLQEAIEQQATKKDTEQEAEQEAEKTHSVKSVDEETKELDKGKKKEPGKLPAQPEKVAKDSREAASDMLKKFFNKR